MATRSFIGILNENETVTGVYCHFDGYPDGVGKKLVEHYSDRAKAAGLIALGGISSLGPRLAPEPGEAHSFREPAPGVTVAYGRDGGESVVTKRYVSIPHMQANVYKDFHAEYAYVINHRGEWIVHR
jgi:hypothetical protein